MTHSNDSYKLRSCAIIQQVNNMAIFQKSVIKKHLRGLNTAWIDNAYNRFKEIFNKEKIDAIIKLKEEEYQDGFLRDLFVDVLGYSLKPDKDFNLVREFKNQTDGKKADGAIIKDGKAIAVIELKSTRTKDLTSVTQQAFNYKNNQPDCKYVITSNFQKLRFYVDFSHEYEEFDLFNLQKRDFELLYLVLRKSSVFNDIPQKLKEETKFHEQLISEKLYKDYSGFKNKIFENIVKLNTDIDKLILFKKSQKLLDRLLFIFFAEDCGLLPANLTSQIIERHEQLKTLDAYKPLYKIFLQYFEYMNTGKKGQIPADDIPAYNGGLFAPDTILDNLKIDDKVLKADSLKLSAYDFNTDVDVNILGHIFEHSLNEIEEMEQNLSGNFKIVDNKTSKRKKDGVFYTPKYITQYIVENTIGTLCTQKRKEIDIYEIEFDINYKTKKGLNKKGKELYGKLNNYKEWLKGLKILDPACGSGAFLNQALQFLIAEHKTIDDLIAELTGDKIGLFDTDKAILENNLYGVDINEESVEIAKLSLWLRTAQKGRKLSNLNNNIKCGNSLIDKPEIAGDKAFDWHSEFPQIFDPTNKKPPTENEIVEKPDYLDLIKQNAKLAKDKAEQSIKLSKEAIEYSKKVYDYVEKQETLIEEPQETYGIKKQGGFDVVIGNPPYGVSFTKQQKKYLSQLDPLVPDYEIYIYFISLATDKLLKKNGMMAYIFPNTFLSILYGRNYRQKIIDNFTIYEIVDLSNDKTFIDAAVRTCIFSLKKNSTENINTVFKKINKEDNKFIEINNKSKDFLIQNIDNWLSILSYTKKDFILVDKINTNKKISDFFEVSQGLIPYDKYRGHSQYQIKNRVFHSQTKIDKTYKKELKGADIQRYGIKWNGDLWISYGSWLAAPRKSIYFVSPRILIREITNKLLNCCYTKTEYYNTPSLINVIDKNSIIELKYALTILNSNLIGWYHNTTSPKAKKGLFPKILINDVRNLPIKEISKEEQAPFVEKADLMLLLNNDLQTKAEKFIKRIKANLEISKLTNKMQNFYNFDFKTFVSELKKQKVKINFKEQEQWEDYFDNYKAEINNLQNQINLSDKQIDKMVYQLYELTEQEITIIEDCIK